MHRLVIRFRVTRFKAHCLDRLNHLEYILLVFAKNETIAVSCRIALVFIHATY